jgi:hypothetical protein
LFLIAELRATQLLEALLSPSSLIPISRWGPPGAEHYTSPSCKSNPVPLTLKEMKNPILLFLLQLILFSCQPEKVTVQPQEKVVHAENKKDSVLVFSVIDSLNKYSEADSMMLDEPRLFTGLFIGIANGINLGVQWLEKQNCIVFFQKQNENWLVDTVDFYFENYHIKFEDLDGDAVNDATVYSPSGSAGNLQNAVFLFDPGKKKFWHNEEYDLENVQYDKEHKFIRSWRYAGVTHCQTKEKYISKGGHVVFESGLTYCPNEETLGETGTLEFYKRKGEKRKVTKTKTGKAEELYKIFDKTFWNSEELYP